MQEKKNIYQRHTTNIIIVPFEKKTQNCFFQQSSGGSHFLPYLTFLLIFTD